MRITSVSYFLFILFLLVLTSGIVFAQEACTSCDSVKSSCSVSCEQDYGSSSLNRGQPVSENIEQKCSGSHENARIESGGCYESAYSTFGTCLSACGTDNSCQDNCVDSYNSADIECGGQYLNSCYEKCTNSCNEQSLVCQDQCPSTNDNSTGTSSSDSSVIPDPSLTNGGGEQNKCKPTVSADYDGVSADGVASIIFKLVLEGEYQSFDFYLTSDEPLRGKIEKPDPFTIIFTPDEADAEKNYLKPQHAQAVGECIPTGAGPDEKVTDIQSFTIEQPPLFFVHGFMSDSSAWSKFEPRVAAEGWQYEDIDYSGEQDIALSAGQLGSNIQEFLSAIHIGQFYEGKKISAEKVDIISHSMGGLVTRYYIGNGYQGDIRKFVMIGTPNHGAWDAKRYVTPLGIGGMAGQQLRPDSQFIQSLNTQSLNPDIEYHSIAGIGWSTDTETFLATTCQGDGVVLVESVRLEGVPLYCTYDAHTGIVYWAAPICMSAFKNNGGGWFSSEGGTLPTSDATYGITTSAILTGTATSVAPCGESSTIVPGTSATVKSPVTLHAYDSEGNHAGLKNGQLENEIGKGVFYSNINESEHQMIKIIGKQNIEFALRGTSNGVFDLELFNWDENGTSKNYSFSKVRVEPDQEYTINPYAQVPELKINNAIRYNDLANTEDFKCLPFVFFAMILIFSFLLYCKFY